MTKKKIIVAVVLVAIVGFIGFNVANANRTPDDGIPRGALPVHWAHPMEETIVSRVTARGNVELRDRTILFPTTQARILEVHVNVGDEVSAGDLLITYDDEILETKQDQLAQARLALRSAELGLAATRLGATDTEILAAENQIEQSRAGITNINAQLDQMDLQLAQASDNITTARNTLSNTLFLYENGAVPRIELDNATEAVRRLEDQIAIIQSQRDAAALGLPTAQEAERLAIAQRDALLNRNNQPAAVNQAQLQQIAIEQAQLNIAQIERTIADFQHEERATVSGTVLNTFVEAGEVSISGRPLMEIADVSNENLLIVVHVPENDSGGLAEGLEVEISGAAIGTHRYEGYIALIHPLAAPRQMGNTMETVVTVEISIAEETRLRAGNTVDADIITNISEDTLVVPLMSTVSAGGGETFVYIVTNDSTLQRLDVTLGEFSAMHIEAIGVEKTHRVVNNPTGAMYCGMVVRPVQPLVTQ
ncbi:MAG: efflux RND transporter periplasmic adaptor subunit [Defluviitaleaceae bacterium]|nr:efflux RND transporter periplasmic adaptor subunit [Defluviitaleaceae bacterium]MCL2262200.1 efflux RND transporter periplasmic adaptor subunit [Defluviitaleaceae bacterium]